MEREKKRLFVVTGEYDLPCPFGNYKLAPGNIVVEGSSEWGRMGMDSGDMKRRLRPLTDEEISQYLSK